MKNIKEIKTTIIGALLMLIGAIFFILNVDSLNQFKISEMHVPGGFLISGILFLLAPDKTVNWIFRFFTKRTDNKD
ncbi:MAG: hypothetical protein EP332_06335 [Bacteroidetes bacterium]|nr:MAG: hypothetical protein EP332_06335 [Bacteroidota bacterium]